MLPTSNNQPKPIQAIVFFLGVFTVFGVLVTVGIVTCLNRLSAATPSIRASGPAGGPKFSTAKTLPPKVELETPLGDRVWEFVQKLVHNDSESAYALTSEMYQDKHAASELEDIVRKEISKTIAPGAEPAVVLQQRGTPPMREKYRVTISGNSTRVILLIDLINSDGWLIHHVEIEKESAPESTSP